MLRPDTHNYTDASKKIKGHITAPLNITSFQEKNNADIQIHGEGKKNGIG